MELHAQYQCMSNHPPDDRDRGFLTEADRRYLHGESDLDHQSHGERRARERIRNRLLNALYDMAIVFESLEDRDRDQVFKKVGFETPREDSLFGEQAVMPAPQAVISAVAFLLSTHQTDDEVEYTVSEALAAMADKEGVYRTFEVSVDTNEPDHIDEDELAQQLRDGDITHNDLDRYFRMRRIDRDTYIRLVRPDE